MEKINKYISAAIMMVIGLLLIILKGGIIGILLTALGVALIVMGILDAVQRKDVVRCVIKCVIGAVIILGGWLFVAVILFILGALLVVVGVLWIVKLVQRHTKGENLLATITAYIVPALYILIGVCLFFNQSAFMDVMFIIAGVIILVDGIVQLVNAIKEDNAGSGKKGE
ncbi:MAG: hypothetical protein E7353_04870 [Clostridiales bacterium]|nr:hypothetical protein [Clostridiales bacterium]